MQYPKVWSLFLLITTLVCSSVEILAQMVPSPDSVRGAALRYNMPVYISATAFPAKRLWNYRLYNLGYAQEADSSGTLQTVSSAQAPYDITGLIGNGTEDPRSYSGADMFAIQQIGDINNTGPVHYGDTVGLATWCIAGDRIGQEVVYPEGRFLISLPTSRNNWAQQGIFGLTFARAEYPGVQGPNNVFVLQNAAKPSDTGVVYQNDQIYLISQGDDQHAGKRVWQSSGSQYGANYNEWLLGDDPATNRDVTQGKLLIQRYSISAANAAKAGAALESMIPDSVAAQTLVDGTLITLKFAKTGKFMRVETDGTVTANGTNAGDPASQFTVMHVGKWICLKSNATGKFVEAVSIVDSQRAPGVAPYTVRASNNVCDATTVWAHWGLFPTTKSLKQLTLMSRSTFGCMNVPASDGKVLTSAGRNVPADIVSSTLIDVDIVTQNAPSGFKMEAGLVFALSVGSRNGQIEVWGIDPSATFLQRYNPYNMSPNPWDTYSAMMMQNGVQVQIKPIYSISSASDGTLVIADGKGVVYLYDWNNQIFIPFNMTMSNGTNIRADKVVAGNANSIWVLNQLSQTLYQFNMTTNFWEARTAASVATDVGVGVDGTVVSINRSGDVYRYLDQNRWQIMSGTKLNAIAVGSASNIWGVYQGQLWNFVNNKFTPVLGDDGKPATGYQAVSVNAAGSCFLIDQDSDIWYNSALGVSIQTTTPLPAVNTSTKTTPVVAVQVQQPTEQTRADAQAAGQIEAVVKVAPVATDTTTATAVVPTATSTTSVVTTTPGTTTAAVVTPVTAPVTSTAVTSTPDAKAQLQQAKAASEQTKKSVETAVKSGNVADRPKGQTVSTATKSSVATTKTAATTSTTTAATTKTPAVARTVAPVTTTATATAKPAETTSATTKTATPVTTTTAKQPTATTAATTKPATTTTATTATSTKQATAATAATTKTATTATATAAKSAKAAGK